MVQDGLLDCHSKAIHDVGNDLTVLLNIIRFTNVTNDVSEVITVMFNRAEWGLVHNNYKVVYP